MKRKLSSLILVIFITIISATCFAFPNEPNGFRNLYWGETLQEVQKSYATTYLNYYAPENSVMYTIPLTDKNISGVYSNDNVITLAFWNNQLYSIVIDFPEITIEQSTETYKKLISSLSIAFGQPSIYNVYSLEYHQNCTMWSGDNSSILLAQTMIVNPYTNKYSTILMIRSTSLEKAALKDGATKGW